MLDKHTKTFENMNIRSKLMNIESINVELKNEMDKIVNELLPIYKKLEATGFSMGPPEFKAVYAAGEKAYYQYGFDAMAYCVKQIKQLCPAPTTRIDETWTQVIDTIKNGSSPLGHNLFK
jgi:hypothetical protein